MQRSDAELVGLAASGNQDAAGELVARYQRPIFNLIARMIGNGAAAEDLAQEAFVKAFTHLRTYDSRYKFSSWLFRIAHNVTIDYLRRPRLPTTPLHADAVGNDVPFDPPATDPSPLALAERSELAAVLEHAMERLRPDHREVLVLRYQEDLSYEEMAEVLKRPLGTVKSDLHRARAALAAILQPDRASLRKA